MKTAMKTVKHSVIIPCRDAEGTLPEQLEALSTQTLDAPWEVIVADNGSTDRLDRVVAPFRKHLNLRLIDASGRPGAGYARNQGVRAARGEQLSFADADDVVGGGWLAAISRALDAHPFVASRHEVARLNAPEVLESRQSGQLQGLQHYSYPPFLPHSGGCGLGVQRWLHERIGGFDPEFLHLEDTDYCWRAQLAGA
jgi:glycosyltransferase involved in cell wall biosynthesis